MCNQLSLYTYFLIAIYISTKISYDTVLIFDPSNYLRKKRSALLFPLVMSVILPVDF